MSIAQQTIVEKLIHELNVLIESGDRSNRFAVKQIEKQANELLKVNASEAYLIFGILAGFCGKPFDEVKAFFDKAVKADPGSCQVHLNYAVACSYAGRYSKELEHMEKAQKFAVTEADLTEVADTYSSALLHSFKFKEYGELTGDYSIAEFVKSLQLSDDDFNLLSSIVEKVHSSFELSYYSPVVRMFHDDLLMSIEYPLLAEPKIALEVSNRLTEELLANEISDAVVRHVSVGYACK